MKLDVILDARASANEIAKLGLLAEQHGFDGVWVSSLLDSRDPFTNLTTLAQQSTSIKLGPIAINPWDIHPVRIAASLYTLNEFADGRARIVIGGGGEALQAINLEPKRRVRAVQECVEILKLAGSGARNDYIGQLYQVKGYELSWLTAPMPQVYVGANMPQMLRMAAKHADGVFMSDLSITLASNAIDTVFSRMDELGRPKNDMRFNNFMAWYVYDNLAEARHEERRWIGFRALFREYMMREFMTEEEFAIIMSRIPQIYAMAPKNESSVEGVPDELLDLCVDKLTLTSTPDNLDGIIEHLLEFKAAGVTHTCLELKKHQAQSIKILGETILPALR